jgi:hypothetical protein
MTAMMSGLTGMMSRMVCILDLSVVHRVRRGSVATFAEYDSDNR